MNRLRTIPFYELFVFTAITIAVVMVAIGVFFTTARSAYAPPGIPFGGPVLSSIHCNCSGNTLFIILDYKNRQVHLLGLLEDSSTKEYEFYPLKAGEYFLGLWSRGGVCKITTPTGCATIPSDGTMLHVGSSQ